MLQEKFNGLNGAADGAKRALVLSPGQRQAIAVANLLRSNGSGISVIGGLLPGQSSGPFARKYDGLAPLSSPYDIDGFDMVIPTASECTQWFVSGRGSCKLGSIEFPAESLKVYDKLYLFGIAKEAGIRVPSTWTRYEDVPDRGPLFLKPRYEGTGGPRKAFRSKGTVPAELRNGTFMYQELITGEGTYGFGFVAQSGKVLASSQHHELLSLPRDGGSASVIMRTDQPRMVELSTRLISALKYSGWGLIEYKWDPHSSDYVLMELNAKLWASISFSFQCQPAFAELLFGTKCPETAGPGLVWPDRLFRSGWHNTALGLPYLFKYPLEWEPAWARSLLFLFGGPSVVSWIRRHRR